MSVERRLSRSLHACLKGEGETDDGDCDGTWRSNDSDGTLPVEDLNGLCWDDLLRDVEKWLAENGKIRKIIRRCLMNIVFILFFNNR